MTGARKLHERIQLHVDDTAIVLAPHASEDVLIIDRLTFKIELQAGSGFDQGLLFPELGISSFSTTPPKRVPGQNAMPDSVTTKSQEIFGCMGMINLFSGPHLIVVSQREEVGTISGIPIYEVTKASIVQVARSHHTLTEDEKKEEKEYISLLTDFLEACGFYFSYEYDITHSAQRISQMTLEEKEKPLWERVDKRFFWNKHIQEAFIEAKLDGFILPVVDGFIKMVPQTTHESSWKYIFISRRGCLRTGARYHTRGADPLGNVANFVETEQIVEYENIISSYVQVRGSIPFFWQQKGKGLKPKPQVDISSSAELAFRRHMEGLVNEYGPVVVVSLIDQRGIEVSVGESFETHMYLLNNPRLKYVAFDFHEKCRNNKYENLSQLLDLVGPDLQSYSYFLCDEHGNPVLKQVGIVRTNCIDCLDRTNVVQSVFARQVLLRQLNHLGILGSNEKLENHPAVENMFKHVWADNADVMSEQYTGTVALKTDFTRTGKRSVKGSVMDGVNSAKRYINKNFRDDEKQEVIDLFLGHFVVEKWNDVITDSVYRFIDVSMINQWTSKEMDSIIQVDLNSKVLTWYLKELGQRTDIPFDSLIQIEKSSKDYKLIRLHHAESPQPVRFHFPTASIREQFTQLMYFSHPTLNPISGFPRNPEKPYLKLKIFVGTWNMLHTEPSSEDLPAWIPKDRDFYAIGTQFLRRMPIWKADGSIPIAALSKNRAVLLKTLRKRSRHEEHKVPQPFSMPCKEYWHLMIRQYLGTEYIALATINTEETSLIVLVRQSMCSMVNNMEVTPVKLRKKDNIQPEEKKGGLAKLKEAREKLKDQMKTNKEKNVVYGAAVLFRFLETSFCMINYSADNTGIANNTIDSEESIMHLKGDYDLHNDFHHVFWFGNLAQSDSVDQKWVTLYTHEENGGGNSVLWRALYDAPMLSEIEVGCITPECSTNPPMALAAANLILHPNQEHAKFTPKPNPPAFTKAAVGIFLPPVPAHPLLSRNHYCTITLSRLVSTVVKPDLYLVCHGPFLVFPGRTGHLKKGDEGYWTEDISVRSFVIDREYIDMLHLHIELWEHVLIGDEEKIGSGVISLKSSGDIQPLPFVSRLWSSNEFVGEVAGEVSLTFLEATEHDVINHDPNHPFSPPMAVPNFARPAFPDSPPSSPPKADPISPTTSTSAPSSFGANFFTKLPFPQISGLGSRDTARYNFFGKPITSPLSGHRDTPPESKDSSLNSSTELINPEDMEISQPITSPGTSRQPTPTHHLSSSPAQSPAPLIDLSSPLLAQPVEEHPQDLPPKLPPKPAKFVGKPLPPDPSSSFTPISPAMDTPLLSDPTSPLTPTPITSPPISSSDSPSSELDGAKALINRIARFGLNIVGRSTSTDQLLPSSSSAPSLNRRTTQLSPSPSSSSPSQPLSPSAQVLVSPRQQLSSSPQQQIQQEQLNQLQQLQQQQQQLLPDN